MKLKYPINLHKGTTFLVVGALMLYFHNLSIAALLYLALHGSYGLMWLLKDRWYPDKQWEATVSIPYAILAFSSLCLYWLAPYILISKQIDPPDYILFLSVLLFAWGVFLHFGSDAQKYFTLKYRHGLIYEGFFKSNRNTNYLGELLTYTAFALLSFHWIPFIVLGAFTAFVFIPNMIKKDRSLSRYPEFEHYRKKSGLILPSLF